MRSDPIHAESATGRQADRWHRGWLTTSGVALALALGIFLFYFAAYPLRHLTLPMGYDPPRDIWIAEYIGANGVGSGALGARPGYRILAALMGALTGRSQLELGTILPLLLVPMFALVLAAVMASITGRNRRAWVITVLATGVLIGPSNLVGENLANLLFLTLAVGALIPLSQAIEGGKGFWPALALTVSAGLVHWMFLPVFFAVLLTAAVLALPRSRRQRASGETLLRTESGLLAALVLLAALITVVVIAVVLRAPFVTIEVDQDAGQWQANFLSVLPDLLIAGLAGLLVPLALRYAGPGESGKRESVRFLRSTIVAWSLVTGVGLLVAEATLVAPPSRFLALLVAVPGSVAISIGLHRLSDGVMNRVRARGESNASHHVQGLAVARSRSGTTYRIWGIAVVVVAVTILAVPAARRWYRYLVYLGPVSLRQAQVADRYVSSLPSEEPVVFVVGFSGGEEILPIKERILRVALSPERQESAYVFPGRPADAVAARRSPPPDLPLARASRPYWERVREVLSADPPIVVVRALGEAEYLEAIAMGGDVVGPGVVVLRGDRVPSAAVQPPLEAETSVGAGLMLAALLLALLGACGVGWVVAALGRHAGPEVVLSLAPAMGAGMLVLAGFVVGRLGMPLGGWPGIGLFLVVAVAGLAVGSLRSGDTAGHARTNT